MFRLSISQRERDFRKHPHLAPRQLQPGSPWGADRMALNYRAALVNSCLWSQLQASQRWLQPLLPYRCSPCLWTQIHPSMTKEKNLHFYVCLWHIRKEDGTTSVQAKARHSRNYDPTFSTARSFAKGISEIPWENITNSKKLLNFFLFIVFFHVFIFIYKSSCHLSCKIVGSRAKEFRPQKLVATLTPQVDTSVWRAN